MNDLLRISDALVQATGQLREFSESPRLDAELLLALALDVSRSYLFAHCEDRLDPAAAERFFGKVKKRCAGTPLAYITGEKEFWSLTLLVSPDTLVPRPETEVLVAQALALVPEDACWRVLDLGTGSGAIALAIARERPLCQFAATDVSRGALAVARENAYRLSVANIEFVCGHWCDPLQGAKFDLIVSNPPYVEADDPHLAGLRHEPPGALAAGPDGLDAIRSISRQAGNRLKPGGWLLIEHGATQADAVASILATDGWNVIRCVADLAGLPRVTVAQR